MKKLILSAFILLTNLSLKSQAHAYDLLICRSTDGINWTNNAVFQDSSGVPSVTQHSTGIYSAFQWFPAPAFSNPKFDKIGIKKSTDGGLTWSTPTMAVFTGSPAGYLRPFDPTIVTADNGNIRMYFSSSKTGTLMSLDSTVHCYSAISTDGINYAWEPGVRVLVDDSITIDPAVLKIGSLWHYTAPKGPPQAGAHHFISSDGLAWTRTTSIGSDFSHNWTGNLMSELPGGGAGYRFYGTPNPQSAAIWFKSTTDGMAWTLGYQNCSGQLTYNGVQADPAVLKTAANNYFMIYVSSKQVISSVSENKDEAPTFDLYPNPNQNNFRIKSSLKINEVKIFDVNGKLVYSKKENNITMADHSLDKGLYLLELKTETEVLRKKMLVE